MIYAFWFLLMVPWAMMILGVQGRGFKIFLVLIFLSFVSTLFFFAEVFNGRLNIRLLVVFLVQSAVPIGSFFYGSNRWLRPLIGIAGLTLCFVSFYFLYANRFVFSYDVAVYFRDFEFARASCEAHKVLWEQYPTSLKNYVFNMDLLNSCLERTPK